MSDQALATASAVSNDGLSTREEFSTELAPTAGAEAARQEVQAAVVLAKRFPRNEEMAFQKLMQACKRTTFAESAEYSFPRGNVQDARGNWVKNYVKGPSVHLAREGARIWGNIRHGCDIIADSETERTIRAFAWDLETNVKVTADATFRKLVQRKSGWVTPDERDLRELTNKHAAILKRNCILELLPKDLIEDAVNETRKTATAGASQNPDEARKKIILAFSEISVTVAMLEQFLGHPLAQASPAQVADLRTIYKSISDGNSTWAEYVNGNGHSDDASLKAKTEDAAARLRDKLTKEPPAEDPEVIDAEPVFDSPSNEQPKAESGPEQPAEAPETSAAPSNEIDKEESRRVDLITTAKELRKELKGKAGKQADEWLGQRMIDGLSIDELEEFLDRHSSLV